MIFFFRMVTFSRMIKIATSLGVQFSSVSTDTLPRVDHLLALGKHRLEAGYSVSALDASPVYLREQVANP